MPPSSSGQVTVMAPRPTYVTRTRQGIGLTAYRGCGNVLLAFDIDPGLTERLAGFAVESVLPDGTRRPLVNRLSFDQKITSTTTPEERRYSPSVEAPFQKFRWTDFPPEIQSGDYKYKLTAMYFAKHGFLKKGPSVSVSLPLEPQDGDKFTLGMTRGYVSSQAYAERFQNAPIRPSGRKELFFDTQPFQDRWTWLGSHARKIVRDFIQRAIADPRTTLDVFAYDIDEPDIVNDLIKLGPRLRILLDDCDHHTKRGAVEPLVHERLVASAGAANVRRGHFKRFSHHKVLIAKKDGKPVSVVTGSANFSVRGLYVQSNNVLRFDEPNIAGFYEKAFEQAYIGMSAFSKAPIASSWHEVAVPDMPRTRVAFSPHKDPEISLRPVADAIKNAKSSAFYAVMELDGTGPVLSELKRLRDREDVFSYGLTQNDGGDLTVYKPGARKGSVAEFSYLSQKVPKNFRPEWSGGMGQVIHHKFVVCDFNDANPVVYTGSSNLAAGGERENGDNLLEIRHPEVATMFAIEAIRMFDHYHFRTAMKSATKTAPLVLEGPEPDGEPWWTPYFDSKKPKFHDRTLMAGGPG